MSRLLLSRRRIAARRAGRRESGVAIVEFAFVGLFLFTLMAGAFDFGMAWRSGLAVTEAARAGARVGAGLSRNPTADYNALTSLRGSLTSAGTIDDLELVVLYRAEGTDGQPPNSCIEAPYSGRCVVLTGTQLENLGPEHFSMVIPDDPAEDPTGTGCLHSNRTYATTNWCPTHRNNSITPSGHYIGFYVKYRHHYMFPIMGEGTTIERTAVMRLEPQPL